MHFKVVYPIFVNNAIEVHIYQGKNDIGEIFLKASIKTEQNVTKLAFSGILILLILNNYARYYQLFP